jgi:predicted SprT family Zn-dependent metalloprotease
MAVPPDRSKAGREVERQWRKWKIEEAEFLAEIQRAFATSPAIRGGGGDQATMAIKSGELSDTKYGRYRVTFFGHDGPHGHVTKDTDEDIAMETKAVLKRPIVPMSDDDVMAWTSTEEYHRGSKLTAYMQGENMLRWLAGKNDRWDWANEVIALANEAGTRGGTVNRRGQVFDPDALDEAIKIVSAAIGELPIKNPAQLDEQVVSDHGELCTIKDCCVVICEGGAPQGNPGRERWFTDRDVITRAFDAVGMAVENAYGLEAATRVTGTLYDLPIVYNARLTRAIGRAMFSAFLGIPMPTRIELTAAYDIPPGYMHRILVHEGCHVARAVIAKKEFNREDPHGPDWRALMVMAGEEPRATCIDPELAAQQRARAGHPEVALDRSEVNVGDRISFIAGKRRGRIAGVVVQKTEKGAMIKDDSGGSWRVGYGLLTKETT